MEEAVKPLTIKILKPAKLGITLSENKNEGIVAIKQIDQDNAPKRVKRNFLPGDQIQSINKKPINSIEELTHTLKEVKEGRQLIFVVLRFPKERHIGLVSSRRGPLDVVPDQSEVNTRTTVPVFHTPQVSRAQSERIVSGSGQVEQGSAVQCKSSVCQNEKDTLNQNLVVVEKDYLEIQQKNMQLEEQASQSKNIIRALQNELERVNMEHKQVTSQRDALLEEHAQLLENIESLKARSSPETAEEPDQLIQENARILKELCDAQLEIKRMSEENQDLQGTIQTLQEKENTIPRSRESSLEGTGDQFTRQIRVQALEEALLKANESQQDLKMQLERQMMRTEEVENENCEMFKTFQELQHEKVQLEALYLSKGGAAHSFSKVPSIDAEESEGFNLDEMIREEDRQADENAMLQRETSRVLALVLQLAEVANEKDDSEHLVQELRQSIHASLSRLNSSPIKNGLASYNSQDFCDQASERSSIFSIEQFSSDESEGPPKFTAEDGEFENGMDIIESIPRNIQPRNVQMSEEFIWERLDDANLLPNSEDVPSEFELQSETRGIIFSPKSNSNDSNNENPEFMIEESQLHLGLGSENNNLEVQKTETNRLEQSNSDQLEQRSWDEQPGNQNYTDTAEQDNETALVQQDKSEPSEFKQKVELSGELCSQQQASSICGEEIPKSPRMEVIEEADVGSASSDIEAATSASTLPPLHIGQMRFNNTLLPDTVEVFYTDPSTCLGGILKASAEAPAYLVHALLCPEDCVSPESHENPTSDEEQTIEVKPNTGLQYWGIVSGTRFWEVQIIEHIGLIVIGVCTHNTNTKEFDPKDGSSWQYSTERCLEEIFPGGRKEEAKPFQVETCTATISHSGSSFSAAQFSLGDVIGVEVDFKAGSVSFFRNGVSVGPAFENINLHASLSAENPPDCRGLRPFVFLSGNSSVQLLGYKNGTASLVTSYAVEGKTFSNTFVGMWENGYRHGKGMFHTKDCSALGHERVCYGSWHNGYMEGIFLSAQLNEKQEEENPECVVYECGQQVRVATSEEAKDLLDLWLETHQASRSKQAQYQPEPLQAQPIETKAQKTEIEEHEQILVHLQSISQDSKDLIGKEDNFMLEEQNRSGTEEVEPELQAQQHQGGIYSQEKFHADSLTDQSEFCAEVDEVEAAQGSVTSENSRTNSVTEEPQLCIDANELEVQDRVSADEQTQKTGNDEQMRSDGDVQISSEDIKDLTGEEEEFTLKQQNAAHLEASELKLQEKTPDNMCSQDRTHMVSVTERSKFCIEEDELEADQDSDNSFCREEDEQFSTEEDELEVDQNSDCPNLEIQKQVVEAPEGVKSIANLSDTSFERLLGIIGENVPHGQHPTILDDEVCNEETELEVDVQSDTRFRDIEDIETEDLDQHEDKKSLDVLLGQNESESPDTKNLSELNPGGEPDNFLESTDMDDQTQLNLSEIELNIRENQDINEVENALSVQSNGEAYVDVPEESNMKVLEKDKSTQDENTRMLDVEEEHRERVISNKETHEDVPDKSSDESLEAEKSAQASIKESTEIETEN